MEIGKKIRWAAFLFSFVLFLQTGKAQQSDEIHFRYNSVGYFPADAKIVIVFSNQLLKGDFHIVENETGKRVSTHKMVPSKASGYGPFKYYYEFDFSPINKSGTYRIEIPKNKIKSGSIRIGENLYQKYPEDLLGFMRQQRCGYNPFFDEVCHQKDGRAMDGPVDDSTYVDVTGGWHDAGDQLKYLITGSNATARMLMAYQLYPDAFGDFVNALGQNGGNEIPDVLDEAKWGLDWIHKMHPSSDQLIHQVADDRDHLGWKLPKADPSNYGWGKDSYRVAYFATGKPQGLGKFKSQATGISNLAGRSAAALALGHQVWKKLKLDEPFALQCLKDAEELYSMAKQKQGFQQGNSYGAPYRYNEDTWTDDMEWASAELFRATGKTEYLEDAKHYAELTGELSWIQKDTSAHYQFYPFLNIAHFSLYGLVDDPFKSKLASYYKNGIEKTLQRAKENVFQNGVPFIWCSNNLLVDLVLQIILYEKMTGNFHYHSYLLAMRDWLFGRNPWGTGMFMNIPPEGIYPKDVHTSTWALARKEVPGGLIDGPIYFEIYNKLKGLKLTHEDRFADFQNPYVVYHDDIGDYSTNEPTMDGTACAVMLMAYLAQSK